MALPEHILDHQARALDRLILHYRRRPEVRNLFPISEPILAELSPKSAGVGQGSLAEGGLSNGVIYPALAQEDYAYQVPKFTAGTRYVLSVFVRMMDLGAPIVGQSTSAGDFGLVSDGALHQAEMPLVANAGGALYRVSSAQVAATGGFRNCGVARYAGQSGRGFAVTGYQLEEGSAPSGYLRSPDPGSVLERLVSLATAEHQVIEDVLWQMISETIDSASAAQLEVYGDLVGQPREGRDDATYRLWIKTRVLINRSDGTPEDIIRVFDALVARTASIVLEEGFPAGFVVRLGSTSNLDPSHAGAILQKMKPGGVNAIFEGATSQDTTSFAFDPNGAGFGHGGATSTLSAASGTSQAYVDVVDASAFMIGDTVTIDTAGQQEAKVLTAKTATRLTFGSNLTLTHASGVTATVANAAAIGGMMATAF